MLFLPSKESFWNLTASIISLIINDHAHVSTQRILNKFIEVNFSLGCTYGLAVMLFIPTLDYQ